MSRSTGGKKCSKEWREGGEVHRELRSLRWSEVRTGTQEKVLQGIRIHHDIEKRKKDY